MPQEPDELDAAIALYLILRSALVDGTLKQYRRVLGLYKQISPGWPPTPEGIAAFIGHCRSRYGDYTTHTYFGIVRGFIHFLLKRKLITGDPLDEISRPRAPANLPRAPLPENIKKLMSYLENEVEEVLSNAASKRKGWREIRNLAMFSLILDSGTRVAEAVNIRLEDVDLEMWSVFIRRGKRTKQREVPLGRTSRADLKLWLNYRLDLAIPPDINYLFVSKRQGWGPVGVGHVEYTLEAICSRENGASIERIRQWLGHTSLGTTARYLMSREGLREHLKSSPRDHQF